METTTDAQEGRIEWLRNRTNKRKVLERGIHHFSKDSRYYYEVVNDHGVIRKFAFRSGECVELDPFTDEFMDIAYFYSPSSMNPKDFSDKKKVTRKRKGNSRREGNG